jgi:hypothetical protein
MNRTRLLRCAGGVSAWLTLAITSPAQAAPGAGLQVCTLGAASVGGQGTLVCLDASSGATTQTVALGNTVVGRGGTGGTLSRNRSSVLVTNQVGGAVLLGAAGGRLAGRVTLDTGGESSLSGALSDRGAYVLTGTQLLFFPAGRQRATSSQKLLVGDGSAAQVTLADSYAYVSEKSGSLEAFRLAPDGNLKTAAAAVMDVPAGTIVGITGLDGLVVAPVAHLASDPNQSTVPVASGTATIQDVETREVAACWAADADDEVCITNPGSMTISCGHFGGGGFRSYTAIAAHADGESLFDLDMRGGAVGVLGVHGGASVMQTYALQGNGDFLTFMKELPVPTATATGALLLPTVH